MFYKISQGYQSALMKAEADTAIRKKDISNTFKRYMRKIILEGTYIHCPMESRVLGNFATMNNVRLGKLSEELFLI